MNKRFSVFEAGGRSAQLWTRPKGAAIRENLFELISSCQFGDVIILDMQGIEVFDISFASEFVGKAVLFLPRQFPDRYLVVENLTEFAKENLVSALEKLDLSIVECQSDGKREIIGKFHLVDQDTFKVISSSKDPVTAFELKEKLGVSIQAMNERLNKLVELQVIRRSKSTSLAGREQFVYSKLE